MPPPSVALRLLQGFAHIPHPNGAPGRHRANALAAMATAIVLLDPAPVAVEARLIELRRFQRALDDAGARPGSPDSFLVGPSVRLSLAGVELDLHLSGDPGTIRRQWRAGRSDALEFADAMERLRSAAVADYLPDPIPTLAAARQDALALLASRS